MRLRAAPEDSADEWVQKLYRGRQRPFLLDAAQRPAPPAEDNELPPPRRMSGFVADIVKSMSLRPDAGYHFLTAVDLAHFDRDGFLGQDVKQMIATYVSALRSCVY